MEEADVLCTTIGIMSKGAYVARASWNYNKGLIILSPQFAVCRPTAAAQTEIWTGLHGEA